MNKKILSFMCVGLCAAACAEETAFVGQTMGTIPVYSARQSLIVSVAFNELSPVNGKAITAANLVSTKNLTDGDTISIFMSDGTYATWTKEGNVWTPPTKAFRLGATGLQQTDAGVDASTVGSDIGEGFWLIRQKPSEETPFYIYGAVVNSTNKEIKKDNPWQRMMAPFEEFPDANYYHYSLQLSTYKAIVERKTNLRIGDLMLIHISPNGPVMIPCIDLSARVLQLLGK